MKHPCSLIITLLCAASTASAQFGAASTIITGGHALHDMLVADMDGDLDMDVVMGRDFPYEIVWVENMNGTGAFSTVHPVRGNLDPTMAFAAADMDGDGDQDVVAHSRSDSTLFWKANLGAGTFGPDQVVEVLQNYYTVNAIQLADITGDSLPEILYTFDQSTHWWINTAGSFVTKDSLMTMGGPSSQVLRVGDMDMDGDTDFMTCNWSGFVEIGNNLGGGTTWQSDWLSTTIFFHEGHNFHLLDVEGDGDLDIVDAWNQTKWLENGAANGLPWPSFTSRLISGGFYHEAGCAGALGCGAGMDIVFSPWNSNAAVEWTGFDPVLGDFAYPLLLPALPKSTFLRIGDLDADGRNDLIMQHHDTISWFANELPASAVPVTVPPLDTLCAFGGQYALPDGLPAGGTWSGPSVNGNAFDASANSAGPYTLLYTVTDTTGCPAAAVDSLQLIATPTISPSSVPGCPPDALILHSGAPAGGAWIGVTDSTGVLDATCAQRPIFGSVVYAYTDPTGTACTAIGPFIQILPCAGLSFGDYGPYCANDPVQIITANGPAAGGASLSGDVDSVVFIPPSSVEGQFDPGQGAGTYTITASAIGPGVCTTTRTDTIVVFPLPTPSIIQEPTPCANDTIAWFLADTTGVFSGAVLSMSDTTGATMPDQLGAGWWTYGFSATSIHGCTTELVDSFMINTAPTPSIMSEPLPCASDSIAEVLADTVGVFAGDVTGTGTIGQAYPQTLGAGAWPYTFTATDTNGCSTTLLDTLVVIADPIVTFSLSGGSILPCNDTLTFDGGAPTGGFYTVDTAAQTYTAFETLVLDSGWHVITYTYNEPGTSCKSSAPDSVYVDCLGTGIASNASAILSLVPNPANDLVTIFFGAPGPMRVQVMDANGRVVLEESRNAQQHTLDASTWPAGVYAVRVAAADGRMSVQRLVKE